MRRIPAHVIRNRRQAADAEANATYYKERPLVVDRGPCARCHRPEADHFAGCCDDWKPYEPPVAAGSVQNV